MFRNYVDQNFWTSEVKFTFFTTSFTSHETFIYFSLILLAVFALSIPNIIILFIATFFKKKGFKKIRLKKIWIVMYKCFKPERFLILLDKWIKNFSLFDQIAFEVHLKSIYSLVWRTLQPLKKQSFTKNLLFIFKHQMVFWI